MCPPLRQPARSAETLLLLSLMGRIQQMERRMEGFQEYMATVNKTVNVLLDKEIESLKSE